VPEALGDARSEGNNLLFLEVEDRAEIHFGGVDQISHPQPPARPFMERHNPTRRSLGN